MGLVSLFKFNTPEEYQTFSNLHSKVKTHFPNSSEREIIIATCVAGLCARVAYVDLDVSAEEVSKMQEVLKAWTRMPEDSVEALGDMAIEEMKELSGLENHLYSIPLNDVLDKREKVEVLIALFALSAADGVVSNKESEEIRLICRSLRLNDQIFSAARATVAEKLGASFK